MTFVAWSARRADDVTPASHWPHLARIHVAPSHAALGFALAPDTPGATHHADADVAAVVFAPPWGPDAAAVARAYRAHGDALTRHLDGDFAAIVLDPHRRRLFGTTSLTYARPLAYACFGGGTLVSDRALDLLAHPAVPRTLRRGLPRPSHPRGS